MVRGEEKGFFVIKEVLLRVQAKNTECIIILPSRSSGDVRCLTGLGGELPDIILVIDQHSFIILEPARIPIARDLGGIIMVFVEERDVKLSGQVSSRACVFVIQMPVSILIIEDIAPAR